MIQPRAQPSLLLLTFLGRVCGCTATAVDGRRVVAVLSGEMTADCTTDHLVTALR